MAPQKKLPARINQAVALLKPEGTWVKELCDATGMTATRIGIVMTAAVAESRAVLAKAGRNAVYFPTLADAQAFEMKFAAAEVLRLKEVKRKMNRLRQQRHGPELSAKRRERRRLATLAEREEKAQHRGMRAAEKEIANARRRQDREAAAALKQREKALKASTTAKLKRQTKEAGALTFKKGTTSAAPKRASWADTPQHNPNGVKPVELPNTLRDRFTPEEVPALFSGLRYGEYPSPVSKWAEAATA